MTMKTVAAYVTEEKKDKIIDQIIEKNITQSEYIKRAIDQKLERDLEQ